EKSPAEIRQLGRTDSVDETHALLRRRPDASQLAQRGVAEDHIGRNLALAGQLLAEAAQGLEQLGVHAFPGDRLGLRFLRLFILFARYGLDQPDGSLAAHYLPCSRRQLQNRILVADLQQHALADELVHPVAHVRLALIPQQAVGAELVVPARANVLGVFA